MKRIISHRANLDGPNKDTENSPHQIAKCLELGLDVEIDVWSVNGKVYLGHDTPEYEIEYSFLENEKLWCHAKNHDAMEIMSNNTNINSFWHQTDDYTVTTKGFVWCYPGIFLIPNSIAVTPENTDYSLQELKRCYAVCTDYSLKYKELLLEQE
jgi:hypothetical protein